MLCMEGNSERLAMVTEGRVCEFDGRATVIKEVKKELTQGSLKNGSLYQFWDLLIRNETKVS